MLTMALKTKIKTRLKNITGDRHIALSRESILKEKAQYT
jgi:hypothetical protein